jgi:hypothetical protein
LRIVAEYERENVQLSEELENERVNERVGREEQEQIQRRLVGEMEETRRMAEVLRERVGEVERRVSGMEEREEERKNEERCRDAAGGVLRDLKRLALAWSISIPAFISSSSPTPSSSTSTTPPSSDTTQPPPTDMNTDTDTGIRRTGNRNNTTNRMTHRQLEQLYDSLPRYILLVGIGACAFVLRGLVRRVFRVGVGMGMGMGRR